MPGEFFLTYQPHASPDVASSRYHCRIHGPGPSLNICYLVERPKGPGAVHVAMVADPDRK